MTTSTLAPHLLESLRSSAQEIFETMVSMTPSSIETLPVESSKFHDEVIGLLSFTGTVGGTFVVRSRLIIAKEMAARMLMMEPEELTEAAELSDAFGEIVNMLAGNFKNAWVENGNAMELSVPCVVLNGSVSVHEKFPGLRSAIRAVLNGEPVDIGVHFER